MCFESAEKKQQQWNRGNCLSHPHPCTWRVDNIMAEQVACEGQRNSWWASCKLTCWYGSMERYSQGLLAIMDARKWPISLYYMATEFMANKDELQPSFLLPGGQQETKGEGHRVRNNDYSGYFFITIPNNVFSCDQAAIWLVQSVRPSVRPSVCLSVCHTFLAATKQLYEWYFLSVRLSVCPSVRLSVCPSHLFHYVPIIVSSWNFQELSPSTRVTSMRKVKVRSQRSRSRGHNPT